MMKSLGLLIFVGTVLCDPFWKYPKPEKFVEWAEEVIPSILEKDDHSGHQIELHNLANVVYTDILGAKGMKVGKKWMIQAIYVNPDEKVIQNIIFSGDRPWVRITSTFSVLQPNLYFDLNLTSTFLSQLYFDFLCQTLLRPKLYFDKNCTSTCASRPIRFDRFGTEIGSQSTYVAVQSSKYTSKADEVKKSK